MSTRTVLISSGGSENVAATVTEVNGLNLAGDTVEYALVLRDLDPVSADWKAPTSTTINSSVAEVIVLINQALGYQPGYYQMWLRIHDTPEVVSRPVPNLLLRLI